MEGSSRRVAQEVRAIDFPFASAKEAIQNDILSFGFGLSDPDGNRVGRVWQLRHQNALPQLSDVIGLVGSVTDEHGKPAVRVDTYARSRGLEELKTDRQVEDLTLPLADLILRDWVSMCQFAMGLYAKRQKLEFGFTLIGRNGEEFGDWWRVADRKSLSPGGMHLAELINRPRMDLGYPPVRIRTEIRGAGDHDFSIEEDGPPDHQLVKEIMLRWHRHYKFWTYEPPK